MAEKDLKEHSQSSGGEALANQANPPEGGFRSILDVPQNESVPADGDAQAGSDTAATDLVGEGHINQNPPQEKPQDGTEQGDPAAQNEAPTGAEETPTPEAPTDQPLTEYQKLAQEDPRTFRHLEKLKEGYFDDLQTREGLSAAEMTFIKEKMAGEHPREVAEYITKLRMVIATFKLSGHTLSADEFRTLEEMSFDMTVDEAAEAIAVHLDVPNLEDVFGPEGAGAIPGAEMDPEPLPFEDAEGESQTSSGEEAQEADSEEHLDTEQSVAEIEHARAEDTHEKQQTERAEKAIEQTYELAAWLRFKELKAAQGQPVPEHSIPPKRVNRDGKPISDTVFNQLQQTYEAKLAVYELQIQDVRDEFREHWKKVEVPRKEAEQDFIKEKQAADPNYKAPEEGTPERELYDQELAEYIAARRQQTAIDAGVFDKNTIPPLMEQLKSLGWEFAESAQDVDVMTLFKTIFSAQTAYAGNERAFRSEGDLHGEGVTVAAFKEICQISNEKDSGAKKKNWMLVVSHIMKHMDPTEFANVTSEWTSEDALTDENVRTNLAKFYEEAAKAGKGPIDEAFNKALEDPTLKNSGVVLKLPGKRVQVTAELMTNMQLLAESRNGVKEFFR